MSILGGLGNLLGRGAGAITGGIGKLFQGFGGGYSSAGGMGAGGNKGFHSPTPSGGPGGGGGGFNDYFKNPAVLGGLGALFGSQLIGNPKAPKMPKSFDDFHAQANAGGPPGMQAANQYYQNILTGQNPDAFDAASHSLDQNYQQQLRDLQSTYRSVRPGTDYTVDTTYKRDLQNLNDMYARQRAQVRAQVQQGAAQGAGQLGAEQASQQMAAIEAQVNQIAAQWNMSAQKRQALRDMLMQTGGTLAAGPALAEMFKAAR